MIECNQISGRKGRVPGFDVKMAEWDKAAPLHAELPQPNYLEVPGDGSSVD